jgi:hypothetical protein
MASGRVPITVNTSIFLNRKFNLRVQLWLSASGQAQVETLIHKGWSPEQIK